MTKLLPVFLICCLLGYISDYRTKHSISLVRTGRKDAAVYFLMVVYMVIFAGLRTRYNDTVAYTAPYGRMDVSHGLFNGIRWSLSASDGFQVVLRVMKYLGLQANSMLLVLAAFDIGVTMWFVRKYTDDIGLCVYLVFTTGVFTFNMAALMQCTATAFALLAVDKAFRKKWFWFALLLLIGMTFHTYVLVFALTPFLSFRPWSRRTILMLAVFGMIGIFLPQLLGIVVTVTSAMGETYTIDSFQQTGINFFRFLVVSVPVVLSFILRKKMEGHTTRVDNMIINLSMLNAEIMFVALFGTGNYFGRLANYFTCFQVLTLPRLLRFCEKQNREVLTVAMIVGYLGYFVYGNYFNQKFDLFFDSISLIDYLKSLV